MRTFSAVKTKIEVIVDKSARTLRELQELSQSELSEFAAISKMTVSATENCHLSLDLDSTECLACDAIPSFCADFFQPQELIRHMI